MLKVGALLAALLIGIGAAASAAQATTVDHDPQFGSKVKAFLGDLKGDYIEPRTRVSEQVFEALTGPADKKILDDGAVLASGCRLHSCTEQAAVVLSPKGEVLAVGLIHFGCHYAPWPADLPKGEGPFVDCDRSPRLTMFVKPGGAYGMALVRWAAAVSYKPIGSRETVTVG